MSRKDGGSAFPFKGKKMFPDGFSSTGFIEQEFQYPGMTLRDYFAAKAMAAHIQNMHRMTGAESEEIASWAYLTADAMLSQRDKNGV